eukprot:3209448-Prymnesium_polylepis.1
MSHHDDFVDLVVAPLLAFECTAAARERSRVARRRSRRSRGYRCRWGAARQNGPTSISYVTPRINRPPSSTGDGFNCVSPFHVCEDFAEIY